MAEIVIFGAGDIARLAHFYFTRDSQHTVVGFTVDRAYLTGDEFLGLPLVAFEDVEQRFPSSRYAMFIALSYARMNKTRAEKFAEAKARGYAPVSYVSTKCTWLADEPPGENCFILEDNTIQPFVRIGHNVTLWSGNHIGHDSVIGDHCFISSHVVVSGHVTVEPYCFIGVNATLRDSIVIAAESLIGAGAVIMKDTEPKGVYLAKRAELFPKPSDRVTL
jgi:sugar O-acyltransferase (sialic acid O-acetyltransferase NeuD family)